MISVFNFIIYTLLNASLWVLEKILPEVLLERAKAELEAEEGANTHEGYPESSEQTWRTHLVIGQKGDPQTRTGAQVVKDWIESGKCTSVALIAPTKKQARNRLIEGENGLLSLYSDQDRPRYIKTRGILKWKNGAMAYIFSGRSPDSLVGYGFDGAWVDDIAHIRRLKEVFFTLKLSLRKGHAPQMIATTAYKQTALLDDLLDFGDRTDAVKVTYAVPKRRLVALQLTKRVYFKVLKVQRTLRLTVRRSRGLYLTQRAQLRSFLKSSLAHLSHPPPFPYTLAQGP